MLKKLIFVLLIGVVVPAVSFSQNEEEARDLTKKAIGLMENGKTNEAVKLLKKAKKLDPDNWVYDYEIAYAYELGKNYPKALKVAKKLMKYEGINHQVYQLLGNLYEINGDYKNSLSTYNDGLKLFPEAGPLYLEKGVLQAFRLEDFEAALKTWETGIEKAPSHPSNYYWATKIFCEGTSEKIWGLHYGEIFLMLEPDTKRTAEISQMLYKTFQEGITIEQDGDSTKAGVSFSKQHNMVLPKEGEEMKFPFSMQYEMNMAMATATIVLSEENKEEIDLDDIIKTRSDFVKFWFDKEENAKDYPNILLDFHKSLSDGGVFEAYTRWIFRYGVEGSFDKYIENNEEEVKKFAEWIKENMVDFGGENAFHRLKY